MGILHYPVSGENHGPFSSRLRDALASKAKPFDLWSVPESASGPQEEDCPYDMESQSSAEQTPMTMYKAMENEADADWAVETQTVPDHVPEAVHHGETGSPVSMDKFLRCLEDLNARLQSVEEQLEKQNLWNDEMDRGVKRMQGGYQDISALIEEAATLKEQLNAPGTLSIAGDDTWMTGVTFNASE